MTTDSEGTPVIATCWRDQNESVLQYRLVFRDVERGEKVSVAVCNDFPEAKWSVTKLTDSSVGSWEPSYDTSLWESAGMLHLFLQKVGQVDGEGLATGKPEMVSVLEWKPTKPNIKAKL